MTDLELTRMMYPTMCRKYGAEIVMDYSNSLLDRGLSICEQAETLLQRFPMTDEEHEAERLQEHMDDVAWKLLDPEGYASATELVRHASEKALKQLGIR